MRGQKSYLQGNLTLLQLNSWIDSQTRAILIEFSIFNPNINLFGAAEIIVEFLPTGSILTSACFESKRSDKISVGFRNWSENVCNNFFISYL